MGEKITAENYLRILFIDDVKGSLYRPGGGGSGGEGDIPDDLIATDDEVNDVIENVFD